MTIPGVGIRTAETFVAWVDDITRFRRTRQFWAYFGLVPCQDQSASKNRLGHITRDGPPVMRKLICEAAWTAVKKCLRYDYSYRVGDQPKQFGGGQSINVGGRPGILSLRPKGYCSIQFVDRTTPDLIDLRVNDGMVTDAGRVKLYRRKAESRWLEILPPLMDFLGARLTKTLSLEHIDRVG